MDNLTAFVGLFGIWATLYVIYTLSIRHYQEEE